MKNLSINELKNLLSTREQLSPIHFLTIKGGGGEDIRNNTLTSSVLRTTTTTTTTTTTKKPL